MTIDNCFRDDLDCMNWNVARKQREKEQTMLNIKKTGLVGNDGTGNYEKVGCFDCDGYNSNCPAYYNKLMYIKDCGED